MAATSTLKLVLDDKEYEASLKSAKQGMQDLQISLQSAGKTFTDVDKSVVDYTRAIGDMAATSRTAKGKIGEMSQTFVELYQVYNKMTDAEKQSPVGQALSESLDKLKTRTIEAKKELADLNKQLEPLNQNGNETKGMFDVLKDKITLNVDALKLFDIGEKAANLALQTVKGAIESTEAGHDALARAIAATDSITNQFLRSLANADFSNFLGGLQSIVNKAIEAYNTLDEFESYAARFNPYQQAQETLYQTRLQQARAAKAQGDEARAKQLTDEAKTIISELEESTRAYGQKRTDAGNATIRSLMGAVDISDQQIAWFANPNNWKEAQDAAESFRRKMAEIEKLGEGNITAVSYDQQTRSQIRQRISKIEASITEQERQAYAMLNLRDSGDSKEAQALNRALSDIYGNIMAESRIESLRARADRIYGMLSGSSGGGGGGGKTVKPDTTIAGSIDEQTAKVQDLQKAWRAAADDDSRLKIKKEIEQQQYILDRMTGKETFDPSKLNILPNIDAQKAKVEELQQVWESVANDDSRQKIKRELEDAQATLDRMTKQKAVGITYDVSMPDVDAQKAKVEELRRAWEAVPNDDSRQKIKRELEDAQATLDRMTRQKDVGITYNVSMTDIDAQKGKVDELRRAWESVANDDSLTKIKRELEEEQATLDRMTANVKSLKGVSIAAGIKVELEDPLKRAQETLKTTSVEIEAEIKADAAKVDTATLHMLLKDAIQSGIDDGLMNFTFASIGDQIAQGIDVPDEAWQKILDQYNALREQIGLEPIRVNLDTGGIKEASKDSKTATKDFQSAASAISSVGSALQSIEDPGAKVAGIVAQAIATVAQAFAGALASDTTTKSNIWAFIAAAATSTAAMVTTISQIHSATGYARGGIVDGRGGGFVGGNSFSGDNIGNVKLDAGELVLNKSQQNNLANALQSSYAQSETQKPYVTGEMIYIALTNYMRRSGQGETLKFR